MIGVEELRNHISSHLKTNARVVGKTLVLNCVIVMSCWWDLFAPIFKSRWLRNACAQS